ncbi:MAG: circadian clock protein KaiB [Candidatus Margulisiibacteriota bacterium]|nr:MAG: circadian clock protein KaiB [Candidatus Margulisbacteria bacterium GWD2_39_127]OGI11544.1 MAG: circadian clock protein KaiB [Candidatus Margulisbacteria bacterium GWE2_39_32]PZM78785.1 MAG: circadian clock protein KaiB [Candidatus Margulisiibacteriota bacterium]HAR63312.1 circadian clock protein KaiB [Candidatus Margulisiibacteriota bacterium]HCT83794.1 circadian clock protein KaiB [Candidatus Margulisiibacteriota bacterium]
MENKKEKEPVPETWQLRLYVAGETARSVAAISNLRKICEEYLAGHYHLEVIDVFKVPMLGIEDQVVAIPTLIKRQPQPERRIIGNLSNTEEVLASLDIKRGT